MGSFWRAIFGLELVAEALEAVEMVDGAAVETLGLGLETQKGGDDFGLTIDAAEAVGVGRARFRSTVGWNWVRSGAWRMLASSGVYMAKLRQLLKRLASMAARRSWELTGWWAAMMASATRATMRARSRG